ncbi:MAG: hypothetical protein HKN92_11440 [Chitinophagales bacterium]|nr:hypothetical protein [Chitinophagales bacterium]
MKVEDGKVDNKGSTTGTEGITVYSSLNNKKNASEKSKKYTVSNATI